MSEVLKKDKQYNYICPECKKEFITDLLWPTCPNCKAKITVCIRCNKEFKRISKRSERFCPNCKENFTTDEEIKRLYFEEFLDSQEISNHFNIPISYVHKKLNKFIKKDFIQCLECKEEGIEFYREKLTKHLISKHGMNSEEYEKKWNVKLFSNRIRERQSKIIKDKWRNGNYNSLCYKIEINNNEKEILKISNKIIYTGGNSEKASKLWIKSNKRFRSPDFIIVEDRDYLKNLKELQTWEEKQNKINEDYKNRKLEIKKVIEFCGSNWHRQRADYTNDNQYTNDFIRSYSEIGIKCLIIWDYELKDPQFLNYKVLKFIGEDIQKPELYSLPQIKEIEEQNIFQDPRVSKEQLLEFFRKGMTREEIGEKLNFSISTIKRILKKYNLKKYEGFGANLICFKCKQKFFSERDLMCPQCRREQQETIKGIEGEDYVTCKIPNCNYRSPSIVKHLVKIHKIPSSRYKKFFNSQTESSKISKKRSEVSRKSVKKAWEEGKLKKSWGTYEINKTEKFIEDNFKNLFFVGGFKKGFERFIVSNSCPDFVVIKDPKYLELINSQKNWFEREEQIYKDFINNKLIIDKVVEFCGYHWHEMKFNGRSQEEYERDMIQNYKQKGFKCLVIWSNELKNLNKLIEKINEFVNT